MKKRIAVCCLVVLCSTLFFTNVKAKEFIEEVDPNAKFSIYIPLSKITLLKNFTKITNEAGNPLYEVSPTMSYSIGKTDYQKREAYMRKDLLKKISQILYYGYGYGERWSKEDYFATQYLLYQSFNNIEVTYQVDGVESNSLQDKLALIQKDIKNASFPLEDFTTMKENVTIEKTYLVDNFLVEGEDINVTYEKDKIIISFLHEKENYVLTFIPKNDCNHMQVWNSINTELMERMPLCEEKHKVNVKVERKNEEIKPVEPDEKQENPKKEEHPNKNNYQDKGFQEVHVPNTYQNDYSFLLFCIVGALFVFKK